jgi:hypothetical protein
MLEILRRKEYGMIRFRIRIRICNSVEWIQSKCYGFGSVLVELSHTGILCCESGSTPRFFL